MPDQACVDLSEYRMQCARECLADAEKCSEKGAANRSYYAIFNAMRAVLATEGADFKKHSAVISYFRQRYIKTGALPALCSEIIDHLLFIRHESDYGDFFVITNEEVQLQLQSAGYFIEQVARYLQTQGIAAK